MNPCGKNAYALRMLGIRKCRFSVVPDPGGPTLCQPAADSRFIEAARTEIPGSEF